MLPVKQERTGWRDEGLSRKHREWGWDCPMIDIDFLALEYDSGKAVAIVEYKNQRALSENFSHKSYQALINLADKAQLPLFAVWYTEDFYFWEVYPLNKYAVLIIPESTTMTEKEYVEFLYSIRSRVLPEDLKSIFTLRQHQELLREIQNISHDKIPYNIIKLSTTDINIESNKITFTFATSVHHNIMNRHEEIVKKACRKVFNKNIEIVFVHK